MSKYFEYMQERDEVLKNIKSSKELLSRLERELKSLDDKIRDVIPEKKTTLDIIGFYDIETSWSSVNDLIEPLVINNSENN
jgi:predicted CopG family antitoxin